MRLPRLIPEDMRDSNVLRLTRLVLAVATLVSHAIGVAVVVLLLVFVLPVPDEVEDDGGVILRNLVVAGGYILVAFPIGIVQGIRATAAGTGWLAEGREPTADERRRSLRLPLRLALAQSALWGVAAVLLFVLDVFESFLLALEVGLTVGLGGVATASITYLLASRIRRPVVARLLAEESPEVGRLGVTLRALLVWALGTTLPVAGLVILAAVALGVDVGARELARSALVLGLVSLVVGFIAMLFFARSLGDPLAALRDAVRRVEDGDLDVQVPVYDATEIGYLQAGFNRMVAGLRERERVRDLFGRHVGEDVARRALDEEVTLGGEERQAAALFVDVIGSTELAARSSPTEVVAALNAFFGVVVAVAREHGGLVNKFEGDAVLVVFGAPLPQDDPAGAALAAARDLGWRLAEEVEEVSAAVGVSCGTVVAGNVGAEDRFEYTVIGDPVNEASRLSELAKDQDGRVLASEATVAAAGEEEAARWELGEETTLRGRSEPTRLAKPRATAPA